MLTRQTIKVSYNVTMIQQTYEHSHSDPDYIFSGWTPLYTASFGGHEECVQLLIQSGAEVNKADNDGEL